MAHNALIVMAQKFEALSKDIYVPPYREVAKKLNHIFTRLQQSQSEDDDGLVESVGPVKEINPSQFQFQSAVWRDAEAEVNGIRFPGFKKLVALLSKLLGRPKELGKDSVAWETIETGKEPIRISIVAYNAGSSETHSLKTTVGPLQANYL
jgi:hypothetical protein